MKKRKNCSSRASALQIAISTVLLSISALLLSIAASPGLNRVEQNRSDTDLCSKGGAWVKAGERESRLAMTRGPNPEAVMANPWSSTGSLQTRAIITRRRCCPMARCWSPEEIMTGFSSAELYDPASGNLEPTGASRPLARAHGDVPARW